VLSAIFIKSLAKGNYSRQKKASVAAVENNVAGLTFGGMEKKSSP